jgi:hypothetical protein
LRLQEEEAARKEQRDADDKLKAEEKARREEQSIKESEEQADAVALLPKAELEARGINVDPEDARMTKEQVRLFPQHSLSLMDTNTQFLTSFPSFPSGRRAR